MVAGVEPLEHEAPTVASVGDELLEHGQRRHAAVAREVLEGAGQARGAVERGVLGEEARDLEVGIEAVGQPAEHLHDQRLAEDDRGVALLARDPAHVRRGPERGDERAAPAAGQLPALAEYLAGARDDIQQRAAELRVIERVHHVRSPAEGHHVAVHRAVVDADPEHAQRGAAHGHPVVHRGGDDAPRLRREPPLPNEPRRKIEGRPGFAGASRRLGGVEGRHGFPGAPRALGGLGGHFGAPHHMGISHMAVSSMP